VQLTAADAPTPQLQSTRRLLWLALALSVPLVGMGAADAFFAGSPVRSALGNRPFLILQALLCTPVVLICAAPFYRRAWLSMRTRRLTLDTLIGLGVAATFIYSLVAVGYTLSGVSPLTKTQEVGSLNPGVEVGVKAIAPDQHGQLDPFFESAAVIVLLALVGRMLELRAQERASAALRKLAPLAPTSARVRLPDGCEEERPAANVQPGDLVVVKANERVPVDGVIREGTTTIDESMLTGEAVRAGRGPGGTVLAGSENGLRTIVVEATRVGGETVIGQVIGLVARAQERRVPLLRTTDRIAAWYVPFVLLVACGTFAGWAILGPEGSALTYAAVCAVAVLVVSCPCAVGLAAPTPAVIGMRRAASLGVLFRDPAALERLASVDTVLFDKTGTLTEGKPKLVAVLPNIGVATNSVLSLAAAIERGSEHPIGLAIVWEAVRRGFEIAPAEDVQEVAGKGIRGTVGGRRVAVGRLGFLQESGVHREPMLSEARTHLERGNGVVFVGENDRCIGVIVMSDSLRPGAKEGVELLAAAGVKPVLLTGDHLQTATGAAKAVGMEDVVADALPAEKFAVVQKFKGEGHVVAMCGDGVNDAPALVAADVGIAIGKGAPAVVAASGMTLTDSDLRAIASARQLSAATVRTIRQNLVLAFAFGLVAIPVAAGALVPLGGGLINSVWGASAMSVGALVVLANSLRLSVRSTGKPPATKPKGR
jgi:Cu+-exporting ATPase